jgi:hypothetical protein
VDRQRTKSDEQSICRKRDLGLFLLASAISMETPINPYKSRGLQVAAGKIQSNRVEGQPARLEDMFSD